MLIGAAARSCAWSDVDGDGWADLFVTCPDGPNRLYRNRGDETFVEIAVAAGVALPDRHNLGCAFADVDLDGRDDLFVTSYVSQQSVLLRNLGDGGVLGNVKFQDISAAAGLDRKASAVGCAFADVFNRGRFDLYVTTDSWLSGANSTEPELRQQGHTVEPSLLYDLDLLKSAEPHYRPIAGLPSEHKTLAHDITIEDFDHDGRCEIYVGVDAIPTGNIYATSKGGNPLWTRTAPAPGEGPAAEGNWRNVGREWGVDFEANCVCVPAADFDNDGDLDLLLVNFYDNLVLYRNSTDDGRWLRIKAVGRSASNPDALGARIRVTAAAGGQQRLVGMRQIQSGTGYARCSPLEAHFGLGSLQGATFSVEVQFPSGKRVRRQNVQPGERLVIREID